MKNAKKMYDYLKNNPYFPYFNIKNIIENTLTAEELNKNGN